MIVRVGIPASFRRFTAVAVEIDAPILISANALTRRNLDYYRPPTYAMLNGRPAALDSAGFVATKIYGDYIQPRAAYVALAGSYIWDWWAQRDFCCEPEIARDRQAVLARVNRTVAELAECRREAEVQSVSMPLPVLQGWLPDDYKRCADMMGDLPTLVGVGSVCRRRMHGSDGLLNIVDALDFHLPSHVKLHLFGVKGLAITALRSHPRIVSVDSAAWDYAARREKTGSCTIEHRSHHLRRWYLEQMRALALPGQGWQTHLFH